MEEQAQREAEDEAKNQRELKSEERRAVILLGFLAAFIAFYFWLKDSDPKANPTFNFIGDSPFPHVTLPWLPFLEILIYSWFLWAGCMLIYFSEDVFHGWRWERKIRRGFRNIGHGFLIIWPSLFAWVIISSEGDFLIVSSVRFWVLTLYWLFAAYVLGTLVVWYFETITGQKRVIKRFAKAELGGFATIAELVIEGLFPILERGLTWFSRGKISPKLRRVWWRVKQFLGRRKRVSIRYWRRSRIN